MSPPRPRLFVLDATVLIHDPRALFRFEEHDIFLPGSVLAALEAETAGRSDTARGAREVSRIIESAITGHGRDTMAKGLPLAAVAEPGTDGTAGGLLYLELPAIPPQGPAPAYETLVGAALALAETRTDTSVIVVSKDVMTRINARLAGLTAQDYFSDQIIEDADLLYGGVHRLTDDTWRERMPEWDRWEENGITCHGAPPTQFGPLSWHEGVLSADGELVFIARGMRESLQVLQRPVNYRATDNAVWGVTARNGEQDLALNLLLDPSVDFVSLLGVAGSGKTLLALAAGLAQVLEHKRYREIIMTRETVAVGEDIGFLPGTEEEKMAPWMGALLDNLEVLSDAGQGGAWGRAATADVLNEKIRIRSLGFMRGRTFLDRYIIIDEAQNLSAKQMRTLITRAGPGTKMVCLGNIAQIDSPLLSEVTSGLTYVVDRFRHWPHSGHVTLVRGERSRLAEFAAESL